MSTATTRRPAPTRRPTTTGEPGESVPTTASGRRTTATVQGTMTATISAATPTATSEPQSSGLSGGAIGGIAAGAVVIVAALVGLVFYKRRRRHSDTRKDGSGEEPMYMQTSKYKRKKKKGPPDNGISGPLALAPETGFEIAPTPFPPPTFIPPQINPKQHQNDRQRYPAPIAASNHDRTQLHNSQDDHHSSNRRYNNSNDDAPSDDRQPFKNDYYDDSLVHDYYGDPSGSPIGAQQSPTQTRDITRGNLTPAPEYYLGKEDIDPLRDLRGLDSSEPYNRDKKSALPGSPPVEEVNQQRSAPGQDSPRSSFSSNASSEYLTLEQAQKAHQRKMMGHKESIGSSQILIDKFNNTTSEYGQQQPQMQQRQLLSPTTPSFAPDHASMAISDSTMSMIPSVALSLSPMSFSPQHCSSGMQSRQGSDSRTQPSTPNRINDGKINPSGSQGDLRAGRGDPYAESAYSEDFHASKSITPSSPYHIGPHGGPYPHPHPQPSPMQAYSPYSQHGTPTHSPIHSPSQSPYGPHPQRGGAGYGYEPAYPTSPPLNGYSGMRPQQPTRGPGGGGYGPSRPLQGRGGPGSPGYGPSSPGRGGPINHPPHNGYPGRVAGPGPGPGPGAYMPHDHQQHDHGYNQAPYSRAY
ncbi:hypothetical protein BGX28_005184 [Mortierella sp. GBA30]|nr:hypothetical protein BGX28_005184 [Mortierella sp. GBA30]